MTYMIDWLGRLWKGPGCTGQNLHWLRFHGYIVIPPYDEIWCYERTDPPEDAEEITETQAKRAMEMFAPEKCR